MDLLQAFKISSTGLAAHRTKMNVIAQNLANVETTRSEDGGPYKRKMVVFRPKDMDSFNRYFRKLEDKYTGVEVSEIVQSQEDFKLVHNPSHPDADPVTGYVAMPNVNQLTEMADMVMARRSYDANVTVISNTRSMLLKALEIGK